MHSVLDAVRCWLARFICTMTDYDLDLLALWAAHTYLRVETYTTPRLVLDSPVPGSGKTTTLEHLERLCLHPVCRWRRCRHRPCSLGCSTPECEPS